MVWSSASNASPVLSFNVSNPLCIICKAFFNSSGLPPFIFFLPPFRFRSLINSPISLSRSPTSYGNSFTTSLISSRSQVSLLGLLQKFFIKCINRYKLFVPSGIDFNLSNLFFLRG